MIPLCNPKAYRHNWRYPNTAERDWHKGGYSVGDAEYLLPDLESGTKPRAAAVPGPETLALTQYVLRLVKSYPPRLVLDLHEDELSRREATYIHKAAGHRTTSVGAEIVRLLQAAGIPLRESGRTRFGEPIVNGVISRDDKGMPIRDGSIDELLASKDVFIDGKQAPWTCGTNRDRGGDARVRRFEARLRVAAQGAVLQRVRELWRLSACQGMSRPPCRSERNFHFAAIRALDARGVVGFHREIPRARRQPLDHDRSDTRTRQPHGL